MSRDMKRIINIVNLCVLAQLLLSCSLKEDRTSFANRDSSYETVFQAKSVLNSCYAPLKTFMNSAYGMGMEAATDLWYDNNSIADATCDITPTKCGTATSLWTNCYKGIMRCNEVIECVAASAKIPDYDKGYIIAEARVLRALYYYYLTCHFNDVPFYTYMVKDLNTVEQIRNLPRTSADEIRNFIYSDLKDNALPAFNTVNGYYNRANRVPDNRAGAPLALMLMAKVKMWNGSPVHGVGVVDGMYYDQNEYWLDKDGQPTHFADPESWKDALDALRQLEGLYGYFSKADYPLEDTWWSVKNTDESIFEVQHAWSIDGVQYASNLCRLMYPNVTEGTLDGILMPYWGTQMTGHSVVRATKHLAFWRAKKGTSPTEDADARKSLFYPLPLTYGEYDKNTGYIRSIIDFEAIASGTIRGLQIDKRAYTVLGLGDLWNYGEYASKKPSADDRTFGEVKSKGVPYAGPKFWVPGLIENNDGNNYKIFRYADAVLMMAECCCMIQNPDLTAALAYVNQVRERADASPLSASSVDEMLKIIRDERARELAGELHRRYDLVRWGIWYRETMTYNTSTRLKSFAKPCHEFYPIPGKECELSRGVLSNPAYVGITDTVE